MKPLTLILLTIASIAHAAEWKLVWSDEFNYQGLPDPSTWGYEEGFVRNHELQYYTRERKENVRVENGMLTIEGRKEHFKNPTRTGPEFSEYTSASLITLNKASWCFGRIEARAKLPQGKGVWPAFWTLGANRAEVGWPKCGEIDIMEFVGKEPDTIYGTVHYSRDDKHQSSGNHIKTIRPFDDFHIYAIEWYPDHIDFFVDERKYHTFDSEPAGEGVENPFRKSHYLLINLALGGSWGGVMDDAILPQQYLIDYVRVYQKQMK